MIQICRQARPARQTFTKPGANASTSGHGNPGQASSGLETVRRVCTKCGVPNMTGTKPPGRVGRLPALQRRKAGLWLLKLKLKRRSRLKLLRRKGKLRRGHGH